MIGFWFVFGMSGIEDFLPFFMEVKYNEDKGEAEVISMKRDFVLLLISIAVIVALVLPKPMGTIIPLVILLSVVVYLIVDIIRNGNDWKR